MTHKSVVYKYGTGNPVQPNGSGDVRDGIDNLMSFDIFMNDENDTYNQRDGGIVPTVAGLIRNAGFVHGDGDFTTGFTVMPGQRNHSWYDPVSHNWYSYLGTIPTEGYIVTPGTNPVGSADWKSVTDQVLRSDLASGSGSSMIGFTQSGAGSVPRTAQEKMRERLSVKDFGALGNWNGSTGADDTAAIQAAIEAARTVGAGVVHVPKGRYRITAPLVMYTGITLEGDGQDHFMGSLIEKTTHTVGTGSSRARNGTIYDNYAVDSIISIWHEDTTSGTFYSYNVGLRGLRLIGVGNDFGVFAPRLSQSILEHLLILNVNVGFRTFDAWLVRHSNFTQQGVSVGWQHADDGSAAGTGTSAIFEHCWINFDKSTREPSEGWDLYGLVYSSFISTAVDNCIRNDNGIPTCYKFHSCKGISMHGCGAENGRAQIIQAENSRINVTSMLAMMMSANPAWSTAAALFITSSVITYTACDFFPYSPGAGIFNQIVQNFTRQVEVESSMPTGGADFISYSGGSTRTLLNTGDIIVADASGSHSMIKRIASKTYDPFTLSDGQGLTTTISFPGVVMGDFVVASFDQDLQSVTVTAYVSADGTVSVRMQNESGAGIDIPSGTLRVAIWKP